MSSLRDSQNRLYEVIIFALWSVVEGDCPTATAYSGDQWRRRALQAYQMDAEFHLRVDKVVAGCLAASQDIISAGLARPINPPVVPIQVDLLGASQNGE